MLRVLILEPDKLLAYSYKKAFEHSSFSVSIANNGQAAIDDADIARPDLIVMELQLPAHDGLEFLYEFRTYPDWQNVPILINTNLSPNKVSASGDILGEELGVRHIFYKPMTPLDILIRKANEILMIRQAKKV